MTSPPADRALVPWWCLAAAALVGVWAVRPIERVLPPDLVLFGRAGTVYHLRASPPADRVRLAPDVRTLEEGRDERRDSPRREESTASDAVLEVPNGTAARALKVVEDEFHRPVMRVLVLEGPHEGKRGHVWLSASGAPHALACRAIDPPRGARGRGRHGNRRHRARHRDRRPPRNAHGDEPITPSGRPDDGARAEPKRPLRRQCAPPRLGEAGQVMRSRTGGLAAAVLVGVPRRLRGRLAAFAVRCSQPRGHPRRAVGPGPRLPLGLSCPPARQPLTTDSAGRLRVGRSRTSGTPFRALSDAEVVIGVMRVVALVGDAHTGVEVHDRFRRLPVEFTRLADGLYVTAAAPEEGSYRARVVAFGEREVAEMEGEAAQLVGHENEAWLRVRLPDLLTTAEVVQFLAHEPDRVPLWVDLAGGGRIAVSLDPERGRRPSSTSRPPRARPSPCTGSAWARTTG